MQFYQQAWVHSRTASRSMKQIKDLGLISGVELVFGSCLTLDINIKYNVVCGINACEGGHH